ncbi:GSCOCG00008578001-RA-CDS [Cotesia congregata]|nr:GSCOCG00008578001-RA-CDS [Cotesia congregata]
MALSIKSFMHTVNSDNLVRIFSSLLYDIRVKKMILTLPNHRSNLIKESPSSGGAIKNIFKRESTGRKTTGEITENNLIRAIITLSHSTFISPDDKAGRTASMIILDHFFHFSSPFSSCRHF